MISMAVFAALLTVSQSFSNFTFCKENSRGPYELQCIELKPNGTGEVRFKRREAGTITVSIRLSAVANEKFIAVLAATNHLDGADSYESNRKVADLGRKRLTIEMPSGSRETIFNYSGRKDVSDLVNFFEALINQETIGFDVENAIRFERLSIPKRLDHIANELRSNRIADPERLIPILEKIEADLRLMNFARTQAKKLKQQIQTRTQ